MCAACFCIGALPDSGVASLYSAAMLILLLFSFALSFFLAGCIVRRPPVFATGYSTAAPQRFHAGSVPRIGGVAIFVGFAAGLLLAAYLHEETKVPISFLLSVKVLIVLLPALAGGVVEDCTQRLPVIFRFGLTIVSAALAGTLLQVTVVRLDLEPLDAVWQAVPWVGVALACLAIAGLPHAFNIIDGYNGLAATVALLACAALTHVALQVGDRQIAGLVVCIGGATAGFLLWNYPRGLIFAGDGGAYVWGIVLALASILLVYRNPTVSPWFPMLLFIYPVWETLFSIYRKLVRGSSPGVADALHFHQLIYRRLVRGVFHDDHARQMLMRNNRTSPYLWGFAILTVIPAVIFWRNTWVLMGFCALFVVSYVAAYVAIIRFKVPDWLRH